MDALRHKNRLNLRDRAKLAALIAFLALFSGEAVGCANAEEQTSPDAEGKNRHPVFRVADRLERRIASEQPVRIDAEHDVYWSRPKSKDDRKFDFRTSSPVVANVNGNERYFGLRQTGESLKSIEVFQIPERGKTLTAENENSATFHCGVDPSELVDIEMNRMFQPIAEIDYSPPARERSDIIPVGQTAAYNSGVVLIPPVSPGNTGCDIYQGQPS